MGRIQPRLQLLEPVAVPVIPVSGIAMMTRLAGDQVCVTYFNEVPAHDLCEDSVEFHIAARLLWPRPLLLATHPKFAAMLAEITAESDPMVRYIRHH